MAKQQSQTVTDRTYEQAVSELEEIIAGIEAGEIDLEESLKKYEYGMKLIRHCQMILDRAEQTIQKLSVNDAADTESEAEPVDEEPAA